MGTGEASNRSLRPFFVLWTGQAFSLFGSQLVQFALIWWLTLQTGSASALALASIVGLLPQVVLAPFSGVFVDRWNRKAVMLVADSAVAIATLLLAYLFWTDAVQIWQVYLIMLVRSIGGTFHFPAMAASTSLMVPQEQLTRIQGLNQMLQGGMNIAAAPLGALLVSILPIQGVLAIDVVTAVIAIGALLLVHVPQPAKAIPAEPGQSEFNSYWSDLSEGFRYFLNWRGLLVMGGMAMALNLVLGPSSSFLPLLVTDHFNGTAYNLAALEAAFGVGIIGGGTLLGVWGGFKRRIFTSLMGVIGIGVGFTVVGLTPAAFFPIAAAGALLAGLMSSFANGPIMAIFQAAVEPRMQGRVFSLIGSASMAMMPLGLAVAGPLADVIGVRSWFLIGGGVTIVLGFLGFFIPSLVNIEEEAAAHSAVTAQESETVVESSEVAVSGPTAPASSAIS